MLLRCRDKTLDLTQAVVMGILNLTPDSFFDGGKFKGVEDILQQAEKMVFDGAAIIDIGGMSSRPGAEIISVEEELERVLPAVKLVVEKYPSILISVDTIRAEVAEQCLLFGAHIINDISAGRFDENMLATVAQHKAGFVLMHMQGLPQNMQLNPQYEDVVQEVSLFLEERIAFCRQAGIESIIIDPGFGFGKTVEQNYEMLKHLQQFHKIGVPILAGLSRKSMINKVLGISPKDALNGTTVLNTIALFRGAKILRVHDVKEARQAILLANQLL